MTQPITRPLLLRALLSMAAFATMTALPAHAATIPSDDFSLEVSPSPLVAEVKPGKSSQLELKIHNAGKQTEKLRAQVRGFSIAHPSEQITITNNTPPDLAQWVSFSSPTFDVAPSQWFTQKVSINLPESAGFSYPFVIVVSRVDDPAGTPTAKLRGSVAVFTLVNVDKPGATRKLELESFKTDRSWYEYLPAKFNISMKNTGNSIVQPYGNVYVQRDSDDAKPLAVLPVNEAKGYLLPGSIKNTTASWAQGFPFYAETTKDNTTARNLTWNWTDVAHFRFGHYTAKLVAVYNDGTRDVPVLGEVSFWVIPWRIMLGAFVVIVIIGFGLWSMIKRITHHASRLVSRNKKVK